MGSSGVVRVGMMLAATVIVLLVPLRGGAWLPLVGIGVGIVTALLLGTLLPHAARATPARLAVVVAVVVALAPVSAAVVLALRDASVGLLGIVVIAVGAVLHRVVVMIVERVVGVGPVALVAGAVGTVGYALTVALAVLGGTTTSLGVAVAVGAVVGGAEGVLAGRLLRHDLPAT